MKITDLHIRNFKSIHDMHLKQIENALILVGQNNTGKTTVLDAVRAVGGEYEICPEDFWEGGSRIEITVSLRFTEEDLDLLRRRGIVSQYRRRE
ncbi:MAG: AAA family ATPase, partial [Lachnospiraceae bacterium]|nr:AAA family ATPase [Lachnospiraceae bacterium]